MGLTTATPTFPQCYFIGLNGCTFPSPCMWHKEVQKHHWIRMVLPMAPVWQDSVDSQHVTCAKPQRAPADQCSQTAPTIIQACMWKAKASDIALFPQSKDFSADSKGTRNWTDELYNELLSLLPVLSANETVLDKHCAHFLVVLHCYHLGCQADVALKMSWRVAVVYWWRILWVTLL